MTPRKEGAIKKTKSPFVLKIDYIITCPEAHFEVNIIREKFRVKYRDHQDCWHEEELEWPTNAQHLQRFYNERMIVLRRIDGQINHHTLNVFKDKRKVVADF